MAKEWAKPFYNSKAWKDCRRSYITHRQSIDGGLCECCQESIGYIVHHKVTLTHDNINNPSIALNHDNLKYECKHCHDKEDEHFIKTIQEDSERECIFNSYGQLVNVVDVNE